MGGEQLHEFAFSPDAMNHLVAISDQSSSSLERGDRREVRAQGSRGFIHFVPRIFARWEDAGKTGGV